MENLPIDLFIKEITYLPFDTVVSICQLNSKLHSYCNNYTTQWKKLIDDTFKSVDGYNDKLHLIWKDLDYNDGKYDYLVYTQLVKYLDPITQLMIYYRQGDMKSFNTYKKEQQFLALFLLNKKDIIMNYYLPNENYLPFVNLLNGNDISKHELNGMLYQMVIQGSLKGVKYFQQKGVNIHSGDDWALKLASKNGQLEVVKYLVSEGADINNNHPWHGHALGLAAKKGHLEVVKYLIEKGANIHADNDLALQWASGNGHLDVVKYLVESGADIHADDDHALQRASKNGHLSVVKYLVQNGADIHADDDFALIMASKNGHLPVVEYLESLT